MQPDQNVVLKNVSNALSGNQNINNSVIYSIFLFLYYGLVLNKMILWYSLHITFDVCRKTSNKREKQKGVWMTYYRRE